MMAAHDVEHDLPAGRLLASEGRDDRTGDSGLVHQPARDGKRRVLVAAAATGSPCRGARRMETPLEDPAVAEGGVIVPSFSTRIPPDSGAPGYVPNVARAGA